MVGIAHHSQQSAIGTRGDGGIVLLVAAKGQVGTGVGDAHGLAHVNHPLDVLLAVNPVLEKHARRAGHSQHECVQAQCVGLDGVLRGIAAPLGVVVLNEGHRIAAIAGVAHHRRAAQGRPPLVGVVDHIACRVAEREVERRTLDDTVHLGAIQPVLHRRGVTVPVLAHRELRLSLTVILANEGCREALDHIVAEACVAQVVEQHAQIGLYIVLHVLALVVQVAHAIPALAGVVVGTELISVGVGPGERGSTVIVAADVGRLHLVGHPIIGLGREVLPRWLMTTSPMVPMPTCLKVVIIWRSSASVPNELL